MRREKLGVSSNYNQVLEPVKKARSAGFSSQDLQIMRD